MTDRGLVRRSRSDTHGRAVLLSLTAEAETMMESVPRRRVEAFARALARLPDGVRDELVLAVPALTQLQEVMEGAADAAAAGGPRSS